MNKNPQTDISDATPQDAQPIDAVINVSVVNNELEAYLSIEPPVYGGAGPVFETMRAALSGCGVTYNIDIERLKELEKAPVYHRDVLIARGVAPVNGIDGAATLRIGTQKSLKPKENQDGTVDYRDLGIVENVAAGQVLCVITHPTEGSPGISVKGKELLQKKGRPAPSHLGKNTELNADGTAIVSKIKGQVEYDGHRINVNETFSVKENVDNSTGNVKVVGNLMVPGMVLPGFQIEAGRNINIGARAESAKVRAGGHITVQGGVIGSVIACDGDLKCKFIENSTVFVKGDIKAEYIINSNVKCGKSIKVSGMMARIIGGSCVAGENIEANTIGSPANVSTKLELGTGQNVIEQQQKLLAQVAELEKQIKSLKPLIALLQQLEAGNRLTPEKREVLDKATFTYDTNTKQLEEAKKELDEIAQSVKTRGFGRIICTGTIHPGAKIVIGEATLTIKDALVSSSLYYVNGEICVSVARRS